MSARRASFLAPKALAVVGVMSASAGAAPPQATVVAREGFPAPELPSLRLDLATGPAHAASCETEVQGLCDDVDLGVTFALSLTHPLSDDLSIGVAAFHSRFGGTPDTSYVSFLTVPFEVHSGFSDAAAFRFGVHVGLAQATDGPCNGDFALGLGAGGRLRMTDTFGLSLSLIALAAPGGCEWNAAHVPNYVPPTQAQIFGTVQLLLGVTADL